MTINGLSLTLLSASHQGEIPELSEWLPEVSVRPIPIPTVCDRGVVKVLLALPQCEDYPELLRGTMAGIAATNAAVRWQEKTYNVAGIESDRDDLHTLSLTFHADEVFPKSTDFSRAFHATVLDWFRTADPVLSETLHKADPMPLRLNYRTGNRGKTLQLYISLLRGDILASFLWGAGKSLGKRCTFVKTDCYLDPQLKIIQATTWETLAATESTASIAFNFHTPTSFKQDGNIQPFLLPQLVFGSLLRRWNVLAPKSLHLPIITDWSVRTAAYDLKTEAIYFNKAYQIGATGWVRYEFQDPEQAAIASVLAAYAPFSGIGRKTAQGMGCVSLRPVPRKSG